MLRANKKHSGHIVLHSFNHTEVIHQLH